MKHFPFSEICVQRQGYHPWLELSVPTCVLQERKTWSWPESENFLNAIVCGPRSDSVTLRGDTLPRLIRTAGFRQPEKQRVQPRMCVLLSRSPSGGQGQEKLLFAETIHCHPLGAPPGLRGYSKEPQTCPAALNWVLWLGLCVWRLTQAGTQGNNKWNSKILSIHQHFQELSSGAYFITLFVRV